MLTFGTGPDIDRLSALYRYGVLSGPLVFDDIAGEVSRALGGMTVQVVFVDDHRLWTRGAAGALLEESVKQGSMSAAVIDQMEPLVIRDAAKDDRFLAAAAVVDTPKLRAYAGVCLRTPDNHPIGVIFTADTRPRLFKEGHVSLLARGAARVMETLEARRAGRLDETTGALLPDPFEEQVEALADLSIRYRRDLSLLVVEVDPFRTLLQSFKEDLGRLLIDRMGGLGRNKVRRLDSFGRLSESTFAVLLPDTSAAGARKLALRMVEGLKEGWCFPTTDGAGQSAVGIGVATVRSQRDGTGDLVRRALEECRRFHPVKDSAEVQARDARVA